MARTNVYVDGFNLYFGALRKTPYRWLNLEALCREMLAPTNVLGEIKYFTARIKDRGDDPDQPVRQQLYLRALATQPSVSVEFGHFLTSRKMARTVSGEPPYVLVWKTEEKGSDVNLATQLLHDAHLDRFDVAVVVSNDSDLVSPMRVVRKELGKKIGVLNPHKVRSSAMRPVTDFYKPITAEVLAKCQFPDTMTDAHGTFTKPAGW